MSQMKSRMKSNAMRREHHELEKALRNRERSNDDHSNDTLNEHTESISSCDIIEESNEREKKIEKKQTHKVLALRTVIV